MVADDVWIVDANIALRVAPDQDGKSIQGEAFPGMRTMPDVQSSVPRSRRSF
jgi:hypothetical protein